MRNNFNPYGPGRPREVNIFKSGTNAIPRGMGEYRIMTKTKEVVYIGIANNLQRRAKQHIQTGKLNKTENCIFAYKSADTRASWKTIGNHEAEKIRQHEPKLNRRNGGAGRPPLR